MILDEGDWYWQGSEEECGDCHYLFPMCWMVMCDNGQIRCFDCFQKNLAQEKEFLKNMTVWPSSKGSGLQTR